MAGTWFLWAIFISKHLPTCESHLLQRTCQQSYIRPLFLRSGWSLYGTLVVAVAGGGVPAAH